MLSVLTDMSRSVGISTLICTIADWEVLAVDILNGLVN